MPNLFTAIKQDKKIAIFIVLLILCITLLAIYLLPAPQIHIRNTSKYYTVSYQPTKKFNQILDDWGLWRKNKIYYHDQKYTTINQLEFVFTDKEQSLIKEHDEGNNVLWSANIGLKDENTFVVYIHLSSKNLMNEFYKNNKDRNFDKQITSIALNALYISTHDFFMSNENDPTLKNINVYFVQHPSDIPFHIQLSK